MLCRPKIFTPRAKLYFKRGQNSWSRNSKWGSVHLCGSYSFEDMPKNVKISVFKWFIQNHENYDLDIFHFFIHISDIILVTGTYDTSF